MLGPEPVQVEVLQFHPTADGVLVSAAGTAVKVWDVAKQQALTGRSCAGHPSPGIAIWMALCHFMCSIP